MPTLTDLLDVLKPETLAAITADVRATGRVDLAAFLAHHLGTTIAPPAALRRPSPLAADTPGAPQLTLTPLDAPVPPMLEDAIGYDGPARWVAFYWQSAGDECCWDDGRASLTGANWGAYLAYTQHRAVWPHLALYDFGSSDEPARHWLVLDRETRQLYAAPWDVAAVTLRRQERSDPLPTLGELPSADELIELLGQSLYTDPAQIAAQMAQAAAVSQSLETWLDDYQAQHEEM